MGIGVGGVGGSGSESWPKQSALATFIMARWRVYMSVCECVVLKK